MESGTEARLAGSQGIEGDWQGTVGEKKHRLVVSVRRNHLEVDA